MAAVSIVSGPAPVPDIAALTGPDGHASISVPCDGEYGVVVNAEDYAVVVNKVRAVRGKATCDVMLKQ